MRGIAHRAAEIALTLVSASLLVLAILTATTVIPIKDLFRDRGAAQPVVHAFNASVTPLMMIPIPPWYAQGMNPPPRVDHLFFTFNLTIDFTPAWDWNTHAVYVSCFARYRTARYTLNEVMLQDTVLRHRDRAVWELRNEQKYPLEDAESGTLAGARVQLLLRYQVVHTFGYSRVVEMSPMGQSSIVFTTPKTYASISGGVRSDNTVAVETAAEQLLGTQNVMEE